MRWLARRLRDGGRNSPLEDPYLPAQAEPVTHQFTGQLTTITNGSNGSLDLTGPFTLGQAVTLEYTIERDTPAVPQNAYTSAYTDAMTDLAFSIESWSGTGTPAYSLTTVLDNAPSPGLASARTQAVAYDQYSAQVMGGITAPAIGGSTLQSLTYTFDDVEGTVFGSTLIPRQFPDLAGFEGRMATRGDDAGAGGDVGRSEGALPINRGAP